MRPVEHFLSELQSQARSRRGLDDSEFSRLSSSFSRLAAPVVGAAAAQELFFHWKDRYASGEGADLLKLGYIAAFLLEEYDDPSMDLQAADFEALRDVLDEAAETLDLKTLTTLMGELVARGFLD